MPGDISRLHMQRMAALLVAIAVGLPGCFTIVGTIGADGSARFQLRYYLDRHATFTGEARRLGSEHVKVAGVRGIGARQAIAELSVDDVTRLGSADMFRNVEVTRTHEDGAESLRIVIRSPYDAAEREVHGARAREHPEVEAPVITLALPGPVLEARPDAEVDGASVTWRFPLIDFARAERVELTVRYARPARD